MGDGGTILRTTNGGLTFIGSGKKQVSPDKYTLEQNYPNPFNPSTTIKFSFPKAGNVSLKVYDVLGKEVIILLNSYKAAGD